jgi:hypothetical protein
VRIDCKRYVKALKPLKNLILLKKDKSHGDFIADLSASTGIPLVAIYQFVMLDSVLGPIPELKEQYDSIVKFYKYTELNEIKEEDL